MKFRNQDRIDAEEAELERLEAEYRQQYGEQPLEEKNAEPPVDENEEKTWKKRHGDLRSFTQKQINEKDKLIAELTKERDLLKTNSNFPADRAEAEAWVKEYPDLARVIGTLIDERSENRFTSVTEEMRSLQTTLEAERAAFQKDKALSIILKAHPDFLALIEEKDFQDWVEDQPKKRAALGQSIYDSLYNNDTDAQSAIEAVNFYKMDQRSKKNPTNPSRDAVTSVRRTPAAQPSTSDGKRTFTESEIDKMDRWTYDKFEDEIDAARREGRITYDISGAAR